jgi:hypothetical protein
MALKLTPHVLRAAYDLLAATEPFIRWNLPDGEDVKFVVSRGRKLYGWHCKSHNSPHTIAASDGLIGQLHTLLETMAHEMIHLHGAQAGLRCATEHNAEFRKFAAQVCKVHTAFDQKNF